MDPDLLATIGRKVALFFDVVFAWFGTAIEPGSVSVVKQGGRMEKAKGRGGTEERYKTVLTWIQ